MDANLHGECIHRTSESIVIYNTSKAVNRLPSVDWNSPEQEEHKCSHFSIRGYVARVRNSDKKSSWPFHSDHNECILESNENLLPPLAVAEFRWWNCENCLLYDGARERDESREGLPEENGVRKYLPDMNVDLEADANTQKHLITYPIIRYKMPLSEALPIKEHSESAKDTSAANVTDEGALLCDNGDKELQPSFQAHKETSAQHCQAGEHQNFHMHEHPHGVNGSHLFSELPKSLFEDTSTLSLCDGSPTKNNPMPKEDRITCQQNYGNGVANGRKNILREEDNSSVDAVPSINPPDDGMVTHLPDECPFTELNGLPKHDQLFSQPSYENKAAQTREDALSRDLELTTDPVALCPEDCSPESNKTHLEPAIHASTDCRNDAICMDNDILVESEEEEDEDVDPRDNRNGTLCKRRVRRTRMLSDIIESEASRMANPIPKISRTFSAYSEDEASYVEVKDTGKADNQNEDVESISKKSNNSKDVSAFSVLETTPIDGKVDRKAAKLKEEVNHASKAGKTGGCPVISNLECQSLDEKNNRNINNLKDKVKNRNKKHKKSKLILGGTTEEATDTNDKSNGGSDTPKGDSKHSSMKHKFFAQKKERIKTKKKSRSLLETVDDGSSLIHWMKKTSKKVEAFKQSADHKKKVRLCSHEENIGKHKKEKEMSFANEECQDVGSVKNDLAQKQLPLNDSSSRKPESPKCVTKSDKPMGSSHQIEKSQAGACGNLSISKQKEPDSLLKEKTINDGGRCIEVSGKDSAHKDKHKADTTSVDGIPVEILKLLQENWHKRHADESSNVKMGDASTSKEIDNVKKFKLIDLNASEEATELQSQQQDYVASSTVYSLGKEPFPSQPEDYLGKSLPHLSLRDQYDTMKRQHGNEYMALGKCKNTINLNQQFKVSNTLLESSDYRKHDKNGLSMHPVPVTRDACFHQDLNQQWVVNSEKDISDGFRIPSHIYHGGLYDGKRSSITFGMKDTVAPISQTSCKDNNAPTDYLLKRKRFPGETMFTKATDEPVDQLQKRKNVINFKNYIETSPSEISYLGARKDYNCEIIRPLDLRTNETISALNLLRLMDPDVCSSAHHMCASADKNSCKLSEHSKFSNNYVPRGSFKVISGNMSDIENKSPQVAEGINWHCHSRNSLAMYNPTGRIGGSAPFYLRNGVTGMLTHDPTTSFHPSVEKDYGEVHPYMQNSSNSRNMSVSKTATPHYSFLSSSQETTLTYPSHTNLSFGRMVQARQRDKVAASPICGSSSTTEICVVNRNPADFTIPGEDNEYMTGYEDLPPRKSSLVEEKDYFVYPDHQRKRKASSSLTIKGFPGS